MSDLISTSGQFKTHVTPTHLGASVLDPRLARHFGSGDLLVDLGCGSGYALDMLASGYRDAIGLDISLFRYDHRQDSDHRWRFVPADLDAEFPVDSGAADAVLANQIIEHVQNPLHFMNESFRILKPGGTLVLATPNVAYVRHVFRLLRGYGPMTANGARTLESWDEGHIHFFTPKDLEWLASSVGFGSFQTRALIALRGKFAVARRALDSVGGNALVSTYLSGNTMLVATKSNRG